MATDAMSSVTGGKAAAVLFHEGQAILAYHGALIYKAKVLATRMTKTEDGTEQNVMVHYDGWNKKWDEWIGPDRALELNDANLELQRVTKEQANELRRKQKSKGKAKAKSGDKGKNGKQRGVKRKIDAVRQTEEDGAAKVQLKVPMPFILRKALVDDWEMITQRDRVIALPRKPTVASILDDYLSCKKKHDRVLTEVVEAIRLYFDRALGTVLLYRSERSQFEKTLHDAGSKVPMSQLYGAEHLLRLFVKLPGLLGQADFSDTSEVQAVQARLGDILKFIAKRQGQYFCGPQGYLPRGNSKNGSKEQQ